MTVITFTIAVAVGSVAAGFLGALTGLGGGVVLVPMLVLLFGVDIRCNWHIPRVGDRDVLRRRCRVCSRGLLEHFRVGMFLEIATTLGALSGAVVATRVPTSGLAIVFGCVLLYSAYLSGHRHDLSSPEGPPDRWATLLRLDSTYPTPAGERRYHVRGVPAGFGLMYVAGVLSGLLGIGSGAVKVLAMDQAMRLPFKVSTTTSNFMIGVTAAASAGVYLRRGYIDPGLAMPVVLGVLFGSMQGARVLASAPAHRLRVVFMWVIVALAAEMLFNSVTGRI